VFRQVDRSRYWVPVATQAFCLLLGLPLKPLYLLIVFVSLLADPSLKASGLPNLFGNY
jgi:hypothetical protein